MKIEDIKALEELALELKPVAAAKFLRDESKGTMIECIAWVKNLAYKNPESFLAQHSMRVFDD